MRIVGRSLGFALIAGVLFLLLVQAWDGAAGMFRSASRLDLPTDGASQAISYVAKRDRWLEFRLSGATDRIRIRSHGIVDRDEAFPLARPFSYALEYKLLDAGGETLDRRTYHYEVGVRLFRDPESGLIYSPSVPKDAPGFVTLADLTTLDLSLVSNAAAVQVRLIESDARLREVDVRVYEPQSLPAHTVAGAWERLTADEQERLASGNVYPAALLRGTEKLALLQREWRPIGPIGVSGEDYEERKLLVREGPFGLPVGARVFPSGVYVDRWHTGIVRIDHPGKYLVRAISLDWSRQSLGDKLDPLRLKFTDELGAISQYDVEWLDQMVDLPLELATGTLVADTQTAASIRIYRGESPGLIELDLGQRQIRGLAMAAGQSFDYRIHHRSGLPALLRLEFQQLIDMIDSATARPADVIVDFEVRDGNGAIVRRGEIKVPAAASRFHGLADDPSTVLSEPAVRLLELPADEVKLRLTSRGDVLVTASTRPQERFGEADGSAMSDLAQWFSIQPIGWDPLVLEEKSIVIVEQHGG